MGRLTGAAVPAKGLTGRYAPLVAARELAATSADGARLHVEVHGRDEDPAVVLIHGWTCATVFWSPVIRKLTAEGHRVIAYDQRGHGRTPAATPYAYSPATLADDLCAVLDAALAPGERAVLGGHSMGGMTLMAAADRPQLRERAAAVLLCSTGAHQLARESRVVPLRPARARTVAHRLLLRASAPLGPVTPLTRKALKYATLGPGASREQTETVARIVHACPARTRAAWGAVLTELDLAAKAGHLTMPAAVLVGTADRLTPLPHARELAEALPDCVGTYELTGMGHMTPTEAPDAVGDVLAGLVRDRLAAGSGAPAPASAPGPASVPRPAAGPGAAAPAGAATQGDEARGGEGA